MAFLAPLVPILAGIGGGSAVAGGILAGTTALTAGLGIKAATSKPNIPNVPGANATPADLQTEADKAAEDLRARARKAGSGARQSTILTSPLGVVNSAPPAQKTLLGS
jgi:hypothetical protein